MLALAVIFFCFAGLILGSGGAMMFMTPPDLPPGAEFGVMGVFAALTALLWTIGSAFLRFRRWRAHLGWVMIGAAGLDLTSVATIAAGLTDENTRRVYDQETLRAFENANIGLGVAFMIAMGALGALLVYLQSRRDARAERASASQVAETFR